MLFGNNPEYILIHAVGTGDYRLEQVLASLLEQCTSKIDRTRSQAGHVLLRLLQASDLEGYGAAHHVTLSAALQ